MAGMLGRILLTGLLWPSLPLIVAMVV